MGQRYYENVQQNSVIKRTDWLIDSGTSNHFTHKKGILIKFTPIELLSIKVGKGYIFIYGYRDVIITLSINRVLSTTTLTNVLWTPDLEGPNLISTRQLLRIGIHIILDD